MATALRLKRDPAGLPGTIDASTLSPDRFAGLARREIERLPLLAGRRRVEIGELFEVAGDGSETIDVEGDLSSFARVGGGMSRGRLAVRGPVGGGAGSGMSGGVLTIEGSAGHNAGEGMTGGLLRVRGDAGDHLAAPLPGRSAGMNRGAILVEGSAGRSAALRMRRGLVAVTGDLGEGAACGMIAGSLFVFGRLGGRAGALMRRGTVVALEAHPALPTFLPAGVFSLSFLEVFFEALAAAGVSVPARARRARYLRRVGDVSGGGLGEILTLEERR